MSSLLVVSTVSCGPCLLLGDEAHRQHSLTLSVGSENSYHLYTARARSLSRGLFCLLLETQELNASLSAPTLIYM